MGPILFFLFIFLLFHYLNLSTCLSSRFYAVVVIAILETDPEVVLERAKSAMQRYGTHVVIANLLDTRKHEAWIIHNLSKVSGEDFQHIALTSPQSISQFSNPPTEIEEVLIQRVSDLHSYFLEHRK
ncbi:unnamed protein product [Rodentolepis nana]|uniref:DFP domain-containing protein n=1 Tax=Rodentolepis nana TaxID=102285 RepID=A0A0R3U0S8_RODNA|nr:unnamed protein product [Rodentolepis nana]